MSEPVSQELVLPGVHTYRTKESSWQNEDERLQYPIQNCRVIDIFKHVSICLTLYGIFIHSAGYVLKHVKMRSRVNVE